MQAVLESWKADRLPSLSHREPDSTYFDLPPSSHAGSSEVSNRTEVTMDVFQLRGINDSVMVSVRHIQACLPAGDWVPLG